jgi:hypothetical protein
MPPLPFADNFLAGSIISLLFPILLLVAVAIWYLLAVRRFDGSRRATEPAEDGLASGAPAAEREPPRSAT